jgi:protein-S-isoprenylcysteine O-methyltransferase Ste14
VGVADLLRDLANYAGESNVANIRSISAKQMTVPSLWRLTSYAWIAFAIYWTISARGLKRTAERERLWVRFLHMLVTFTGFFLLFSRKVHLGLLNHAFIAADGPIRETGVLITWIGVGIAIWARRHIGKNWSGLVTLKQDHQLVCTGPYRWVRHPIYTGLLLAVLGTALVLGEWRGILALAMLIAAHTLKARREEALMVRHFGSVYEDYKRQTGFLIPGIG